MNEPGIVLDAGPLIQLDRNDRAVVALLAIASETHAPILIPGTALAQAMRNPARQARLSRLLRQPRTRIIALDRVDATLVGQLLADTNTSDIADAHVAICARRSGWSVATNDPDDLAKIDPDLTLIVV